jgi:uncharacterized protein
MEGIRQRNLNKWEGRDLFPKIAAPQEHWYDIYQEAMALRIKQEKWKGIPILHAAPEETFHEKLPTIIFFHGFTSAKEHNLHYAYQLAQKGIRVLLPDAMLHGEREEALDEVQLSLRFWEIVLTSIEEMTYIIDEAEGRQLIQGEIGIAGTSMGGITALGAMVANPQIQTAAIMMGSANYVQLAEAQMHQFESRGFKLPLTAEERERMLSTLSRFDGSKNREAFHKRPLFFWHGEQDQVVPFEPTFKLYQALKEDYADVPERLRFMKERETGHAVSRKGMLAAVEWLNLHMEK